MVKDSDSEDMKQEQLDTMQDDSPSKIGDRRDMPLRIVKMEGKKPIVMPKKSSLPQTLSTQLTEAENIRY